MMQDITKREIKAGDYIAYAKANGRSAHLTIYHVREVMPKSIKAHQLYHEDDYNYQMRHTKYATINGAYQRVDMTDKEKEKVDNKTVVLHMSAQALILEGFDPTEHRFG
jgi:hypothetical protein